MTRRWLVLITMLMVPNFGGPNPSAVQAQASNLRVVDQRVVGLGPQTIVRMSPDGRSLAGTSEEGDLCIYDVAFLRVITCTDLKGSGALGFDRETLTWSPDSTRIAFTENLVNHVRESDIWIMDAVTGALTNLTDDGVEGTSFTNASFDPPIPIDLAPAWSPDGQTIAFFRTLYKDFDDLIYATDLYTVAATGGAPQKILTVLDMRFGVYHGVRWSADAGHVRYTLESLGGSDNGIWEADVRTGETRRLLASVADGPQRPLLVDVSPQDQALILWMSALDPDQQSYEPPFALVDLATGRTITLGSQHEHVQHAAFSPDGAYVLYTGVEIDVSTGFVTVLDLATGRTQRLLTGLMADNPSPLTEPITWSSANSVYLPGDDLLVWLSPG